MKKLIKNIIKKVIPLRGRNFIKRYIRYSTFEIPSSYNGKILYLEEFNSKKANKLCIFSHYDKDDIIDPYVIYYLRNLFDEGFDVVFVSTASNLKDTDIDKVKDFCRGILIKENIGYDFGAWKSGLEWIGDELFDYEKLLLCNDSVYAPIYPFDEVFQQMEDQYDFWGITDSYEVRYHIQSYFMFFERSVFSDEVFINFWKKYKIYKNKMNIVLNYEIGLSQKLLHRGFSLGAYASFSSLNSKQFCNSTHYFWKELLLNFNSPTLKIELLRDNPQNIDIDDWDELIKDKTNYPFTLIQEHLKRVKRVD